MIYPDDVAVYKATPEDWYPSFKMYDDKFLRVHFIRNLGGLSSPLSRICVWGADDYGMELDMQSVDAAWVMFVTVISLKYVTRDALKELGFAPA